MSEGEPGRGVITYYGGPSHETGSEVPNRNLRINVSADVRTTAGTATIKTRKIRGELAWLLAEGMEIPIRVDPASGLATGWDLEALEAELASRRPEVEDQNSKQTSLRYSLGLPEKEEIADAKGLLRRVFGRKDRS